MPMLIITYFNVFHCHSPFFANSDMGTPILYCFLIGSSEWMTIAADRGGGGGVKIRRKTEY